MWPPGLAVTGAGGDVLFVEASLADPETGGTGLTLTGQLGDVMKESAQIALSFLRSHGAELELPVGDLKERGVHVHVPAGAVPKDGPSAGVTMTTALASLLSGRLVRTDVAMTGEVSLTGRVLPIGGVKQKLLAAHRAGHHHRADPEAQRARPGRRPGRGAGRADVHPVSDVREVLELALAPATSDATPKVPVAACRTARSRDEGRPGPREGGLFFATSVRGNQPHRCANGVDMPEIAPVKKLRT